MPDAVELELAFATLGGSLSPGTTKTMIEGLHQGGCVRRGGRLVSVPAAHKAKMIPFAQGPRWSVAIPWGDVSTAFVSTGIPDITVYMAAPRTMVAGMRATRLLSGLLGAPSVQRLLKTQVDRWVRGPSEAERLRARAILWGSVRDARGRKLEGHLEVPEGYRLTAMSSLAIAERVLAGEVAPGAWTPSMAFGPDFIATLPETTLDVPAPRESAAVAIREAT